jgi:hypothetical protein
MKVRKKEKVKQFLRSLKACPKGDRLQNER